MDPVGAMFLIGAIVCLLLALQWGGLQHPWSNSKVWGCFLGFGFLISIFIVLQLRLGDSATIPVRVLKQRTIAACALTLFFLSMGLFTSVCEFTLDNAQADEERGIAGISTTFRSTSRPSKGPRRNSRVFG
jgi:hypothetical protein